LQVYNKLNNVDTSNGYNIPTCKNNVVVRQFISTTYIVYMYNFE